MKLVVENCRGYTDNDALVGWKNSRQLIIMEITPKPSLNAGENHSDWQICGNLDTPIIAQIIF